MGGVLQEWVCVSDLTEISSDLPRFIHLYSEFTQVLLRFAQTQSHPKTIRFTQPHTSDF